MEYNIKCVKCVKVCSLLKRNMRSYECETTSEGRDYFTSAGGDYFQSLISAIAKAMPDTSLLITVHAICSGTVHRMGVLSGGRCEDPLDSVPECRSLIQLLVDHSLCKQNSESHVMNQHISILAKPTPATVEKVLESVFHRSLL